MNGEFYYDEIKVYGDRAGGGFYSEIEVRFRSCTDSDNVANGCKTRDEISKWMTSKSIAII